MARKAQQRAETRSEQVQQAQAESVNMPEDGEIDPKGPKDLAAAIVYTGDPNKENSKTDKAEVELFGITFPYKALVPVSKEFADAHGAKFRGNSHFQYLDQKDQIEAAAKAEHARKEAEAAVAAAQEEAARASETAGI